MGLEADPGENALGKAGGLRHAQDSVADIAAEGPEIGGAAHELDIGDTVDDPVEAIFEEDHDRALAPVFLIGGDAVAVWVFLEIADHVDHDVRSLLQVAVHDGEAVSRRLVQTGEDGRLFSVVAGKVDRFDRFAGGGDELVQDLRGPVGTAVVDEHEFVVGDCAFKGPDDLVV